LRPTTKGSVDNPAGWDVHSHGAAALSARIIHDRKSEFIEKSMLRIYMIKAERDGNFGFPTGLCAGYRSAG